MMITRQSQSLSWMLVYYFIFILTLLLSANGLPYRERDIVKGMDDDPAEKHVLSSREAVLVDLTFLSNNTGGNLTGRASLLNSTNHTTGHDASPNATLRQNSTHSVITTGKPNTTGSGSVSRPILSKPTSPIKASKTINNALVSTANISSPNTSALLPNVTRVLATKSPNVTTGNLKSTVQTPSLKTSNLTQSSIVVTSPTHSSGPTKSNGTALPKSMSSSISAVSAVILRASNTTSLQVSNILPSVQKSTAPSVLSVLPTLHSTTNATTQGIPSTKESLTNNTPSTKPPTMPLTPPSGKLSDKPPANPSTQPSTKLLTKPSTKPPTHPSTKPSTKAPTEPSTKPPTKPSTKAPKQPSTKAPMEPSTKPPTKPSTKPPIKPPTKPSTLPSKASTKPSTKPLTKPTTIKPTTKPKTTVKETTLKAKTASPVQAKTTAEKKKNNVQNDNGAMAPPNKGNEAVLWDFIVPVGIGVAVALAVAFGVLMIRTCRRKRLIKVRFGGRPSHPRLLNNDLINLLAESDDEEEEE